MIQRKYQILFTLLIFCIAKPVMSQIQQGTLLSVDSCIQLALENNYGLKVNEQNKEIARKQYAIQKGKLLPTVSLSSEYMLSDQFDDQEIYNIGNAGIQIYQPIWQNGKAESLIDKAKINTEAAEIQYVIDKSNTIYYTISIYVDLLQNEQLGILTDAMMSQLAITVDAAKERYLLGISKRSDVLKAENEYSNIQYFAIRTKTSEKIALQNLLNVIGFSPDSGFSSIDFFQGSYSTLETSPIDSLIKIATDNLPELKLIGKQIQKQEISVLAARKGQYPEIGAFSSYKWVDNPLYSKEFVGTIGLSLRFDIFTGLQKKNSISMEKVKVEQLNLQKNEILHSVYTEIEVDQLRLKEAQAKISNAKTRVKSTRESLYVTREEYLNGLSSMLELIDAQYTDFEANINLVNAQAEYHLALAKLKRAIGLLTVQYQ